MKHVRVVLVILFVLLVIAVAVQNYPVMTSQVNFRLNLLFFNGETPPMSLYLVIIIAFLFGVVFTGFYGITERFRLKKEVKRLMKESRGKDQELQSLRNLPVTAEEVRPGEGQDVE
jgi:lipopolysaccharide assembly protein A